tara:strand:+ start:2007 stop:2918 length:912 start_codon:yes stop_codon:yes gene_type:complete
MSFLKKFRSKEKIKLSKDFFYEFIFIKRSIQAIGASLILSLIIIQTSTPQFNVSATLREAGNVSQSQNVLSAGGAQALFGGGVTIDSGGAFENFKSNMHSYALAQRMWKKGWGSKVFGTGDLNEEYFNKISKQHKLSDKIAAFLLGYKLFEFYSAHDLQSYIKSGFSADKKRGSGNITVSALKSNKDFAISFMNALIIETDNYAKERLIQKSEEIIEATNKQLATSKNSSIASALGNTINSEYFKIANLENDMPYHIYIIDPPHSSEYPVTPNITSIIFSNAIIFLFLSILFSFIQKNKEDLW